MSFIINSFISGLPLRRKLKPGAIPDKNLPKYQKQKVKDNIDNKIIEIPKNKQPLLSERGKANAKPSIPSIDLSNEIESTKKAIANIQQKNKAPNIPRNQSKPKISNGIKPEIKSNGRKAIILNSSPEISEIEIMAQNIVIPVPKKPSTKIFDFKVPDCKSINRNNEHKSHHQDSKSEVLKEKEDKDRASKVNNKLNRLPLRSSFRIAKKKSIESLSDSFTEKVNRKGPMCNRPEKFTDKLRFMAKLQLKFERKENFVSLPKYDLEASLDKMMTQECFSIRYEVVILFIALCNNE